MLPKNTQKISSKIIVCSIESAAKEKLNIITNKR